MKQFASVAAYLKAVPPAPRFFPGTALTVFKKELATYETSKGTIRFTVDKPLPVTLVRKLVKARIAQNEARR